MSSFSNQVAFKFPTLLNVSRVVSMCLRAHQGRGSQTGCETRNMLRCNQTNQRVSNLSSLERPLHRPPTTGHDCCNTVARHIYCFFISFSSPDPSFTWMTLFYWPFVCVTRGQNTDKEMLGMTLIIPLDELWSIDLFDLLEQPKSPPESFSKSENTALPNISDGARDDNKSFHYKSNVFVMSQMASLGFTDICSEVRDHNTNQVILFSLSLILFLSSLSKHADPTNYCTGSSREKWNNQFSRGSYLTGVRNLTA